MANIVLKTDARFRPSTVGPPVVPLSHPFFCWEGSPTKIDYRKKGYPYSFLSTGGPSCETHTDSIGLIFTNRCMLAMQLVLPTWLKVYVPDLTFPCVYSHFVEPPPLRHDVWLYQPYSG